MADNAAPAGKPPEPIAIIGIGCRFPGDADSPSAFWQNLLDGVDAVRDVPPDRWNPDRFYDPRPGIPGKTYSRRGGFLRSIDGFEPECFGIAPREAPHIDPQHRLLLETAWEALEDGGQILESLSGSRTGVFVGISTTDYANLQTTIHDMRSIDTHSATGGAFSIAANRISYCFDLAGPSFAVDTACSSSLVATHLACRSLWTGESELALAGGVNVIVGPANFIAFSAATMLSADGRCKAFDASADGFARGEGAGMVLLKPLSRALADGDRIYATIAATAINQDGRTPGITVPSRDKQQALLREACGIAGIAPAEIGYVEAHGTGTAVGDPIEATALGTVLSEGRPAESTCWIGSVKTGIGHLEAGAGIAGLIKTALCLDHGAIPPTLHFRRPNPHIPFDELRLRVVTEARPWPRGDRPRFAGVNSFGFGGANAHVILREAPAPEPATAGSASPAATGAAAVTGPAAVTGTAAVTGPAAVTPPPAATAPTPVSVPPRPRVLPITARSREALDDLVRAYRDRLDADPALDLHDLCRTAATRRTRHRHGVSFVADDGDGFRHRLDAFLSGERPPHVFLGERYRETPRPVFAYCGQGSQWIGMGRKLLDREPVFAAVIRECDALFSSHGDWSLLDELTADPERSRLERTSIAQPALFAIQVALTALWKSWGIAPVAVMGHSVGEIAAAHVAGCLDLAEAARVVFHRGRTMDVATSEGRMLAAALPADQAEALIAGHRDRVSVAASNSPGSVTLSGDPDALESLAERLRERGVFHRALQVEYAFHSPLMDPIREPLLASLAGLRPEAPRIPMISTVTGEPVTAGELTGDYWWRGLRDRVRFADAADRLIADGNDVFLEVGPHPVLSGYLAECLHHRGSSGHVIASLRRDDAELANLLGSLGALHVLGCPVDWTAVDPGSARVASLPAHPWRRERYWHEPKELSDVRRDAPFHPLLARSLDAGDPVWQTALDPRVLSYLSDHRVDAQAVLPASAFLEAGAEAARRVTGRAAVRLDEVQFQRALFVPDDSRELAVQIRVEPDEGAFFVQSGRPAIDAVWTRHGSGYFSAAPAASPDDHEAPDAIRERLPETLEPDLLYRRFDGVGLRYGPAFRGVRRIHRRDGEALGEVVLPPGLDPDRYGFHPALLDACFQVLLGALPAAAADRKDRMFLPVYVRRATFLGPAGDTAWSHVRLREAGERLLDADLDLLDTAGRTVARIEGFRCQAVDRGGSDADDPGSWLYEVRWENRPRPRVLASPGPAGFIPRAGELASAAADAGHALSAARGYDTGTVAARTALARLAIAHVTAFLRERGVVFAPGERISESAVAGANAAPHLRRLLHRLLEHLEEGGWITPAGEDAWEVERTPPEDDPRACWRETWHGHPAYLNELSLLGRIGPDLPRLFDGSVSPLEILFPDGPTTTLATFYRNSPSFAIGNRMVETALLRIRDALPEGRILRVLEVGAGTGGLTAHLLPLLDPQRTRYTFTDVSPGFLSAAEQRFGDFAFVDFHAFDVDRDPVEQGLNPGGYDVIVASDVLHAARDLKQAVLGLRAALVEGGALLLLEAERKSAFTDLMFGITEGWWAFEDRELRPGHPLLDREAWKRLLDGCGFVETEAVPLNPGEIESAQIVLVACAGPAGAGAISIDRAESRPAPPVNGNTAAVSGNGAPAAGSAEASASIEDGVWLVFVDSGGVGDAVAERLKARGARCFPVVSGAGFHASEPGRFTIDPANPGDLDRLLGELDPVRDPIRGMVHLRSLDAAEPRDADSSALRTAEALGCHAVLHLVQALHRANRIAGTPRLVLVTRGAQTVRDGTGTIAPAQAPLLGLGRVVMNEHPEISTRLVDLDPEARPDEIDALVAEILDEDPEEEVALRRESRLVPRGARAEALRAAPETEDRFRLAASTSGVLDRLCWRGLERSAPGPGEVEVRVEAAGLNFRDVLKALALYPAEGNDYLLLGDECAGRVSAIGPGVEGVGVGDAVVAMAPGSFGSHVVLPAEAVLPKPDGLSFEEAATVPVAFLTAYHALHEVARIRPGESVLIHAGAGGVGMAAVQIALRAGATVFATAGSPEKRALLELAGVHHVLDSRSLAFADEVLGRTGGRGVDVVLNSLAGKAIQKGLECLAPFGRFLELGKRDIHQNSRIGLWAFRKNLSFHGIDLGRLALEQPERVRAMFVELLRGFADGGYRPLPHTVFDASRAVDAFRHVAQARHIGKVVLALRDPGLRIVPRPGPPITFRADGSYLVTGGLGGFGLVTARWIADHGGRHLILMGRSGAASDEAQVALAELEADGIAVHVAGTDVSDPAAVRAALADVRRAMPPIRGVFHAAMVIDDGILCQLDAKRFSRVMDPKVRGAWNLHRETLDDPIDHFVLFSSVSSWVGTPGQGNYVAANAYLDAFAHHRRSLGLPALSVNWGWLDEVGYVSRHQQVSDILARRGFAGFSPDQAMAGLDLMLRADRSQMGFIRFDWSVFRSLLGKVKLPKRVASLLGDVVVDQEGGDEGNRVREALRTAGPSEKASILAEYIRNQVARVLGTSAAKLDPDRPLGELGFDSLMAVELKNHVDSDLALSLPTGAMMETPTVNALAAAVLGAMEGTPVPPVSAPVPASIDPA